MVLPLHNKRDCIRNGWGWWQSSIGGLVAILLLQLLLTSLEVTPQHTTRAQSLPLIGAIRWDAWTPLHNYNVVQSLYTDYDYRKPARGWFNNDVSNHTAIMDQEINDAANHNLDYWAFDWYPENTGEDVASIMGAFNDYMASSLHNRIKFNLLLQTGWVAGSHKSNWRSVYVPYFVNKFLDSQYVKVQGNRPLVYWFDSGSISDATNGFGSGWQAELQYLKDQTVAAGLGEPYIVDSNSNVGAAQTFGFQAVSGYQSNHPGAGHQCFPAQASANYQNYIAQNYPTGIAHIPALDAVADPRPRNYGYWVDQATYGQWESDLKTAYNWVWANSDKTSDPGTILIYAWDEIDEGGAGIIPTDQNGTLYLDAIKAVKTGQYPTTYNDVVNDDNCAITYSGSGWSQTFPVRGNFNNDESTSSTSGGTLQFNSDSTTGFQLSGIKGQDRGKMEVFLNNVSQGVVDLYAASQQQKQTLFSITGLAPGSYNLKVVVLGQKNAASSGTKVGIDLITANISRNSNNGPNLALNKTYSSSTNWDASQTAAKAFDASYATDWQAASGSSFNGQWLQVDFGSNTTFSKVTLTEYGNRTSSYQIQYWNGSSWLTAYTGTTIGDQNSPKTVTFTPVTGSKARIYFTGGQNTPILYEFEVYGATNLALNKTYASSSSWDASQTADKGFDGNYSTDWQAAAGSTFNGQWLQVDFGANTTFSKVVLAEYGNRTSGYQIQYWNGSSWQTACTGTTIGASSTVTFTPVTGSKARILFTGGQYTPIIYEFEIY